MRDYFVAHFPVEPGPYDLRDRFGLVADLFHAILPAGIGTGVHFRFFDDALTVLHVDALAGAPALVGGVAHAETTQSGGFGLGGRDGALQGQSGKQDDSEKRSHAGLATASESDASANPTSDGGNWIRT